MNEIQPKFGINSKFQPSPLRATILTFEWSSFCYCSIVRWMKSAWKVEAPQFTLASNLLCVKPNAFRTDNQIHRISISPLNRFVFCNTWQMQINAFRKKPHFFLDSFQPYLIKHWTHWLIESFWVEFDLTLWCERAPKRDREKGKKSNPVFNLTKRRRKKNVIFGLVTSMEWNFVLVCWIFVRATGSMNESSFFFSIYSLVI